MDEDIQVKYGVAGSSPVFCGRGVRPLDGVSGSSLYSVVGEHCHVKVVVWRG